MSTSTNTTINIDLPYNITLQQFLTILQQNNLKLETFIPTGPAGGNPNLTLSGLPSNIENFSKTL